MLYNMFFLRKICKYAKKAVPLHRVFHGIRFKVNEDWVVVRQSFFFIPFLPG